QSRKPSADVVDLSVSPSVDRLLRVTHDCYVAEVFAGREPDEVELDAIGVLELVDDQMAESLPAAPAEFWNALHSVDHTKQQVVEVAQRLGAEGVLVSAVDGEENFDRFQLGARRIRPPDASPFLIGTPRSGGVGAPEG